MASPPGVSQRDFDKALKEFEMAVGESWVFTSEADVALYRDAYSPFRGEPEERFASAAVAPRSVEEVQAVVRTANTYKVPIYPISTGKNLGYGGSAPNLSGSVVLDLKRMNRILEVSERNASALVEPGVSYFDFYRYIQENKLKVWMDCPDPGWGSLVGNALDHGGGYTQTTFRNHFDAHCGMEVVLANGELLRTGMGALPNSKTWQQYKFGVGPWIDGLFSQSNFGVVTKMGFWLMPEPDAYLTGVVSVPKYDDLVPLVDMLNFLENSGVVNGMPQLGSPLLGGFFSPVGGRARRPRRGGASTEDLEDVCAAPRHRLLELHGQVLRSAQSDSSQLGILRRTNSRRSPVRRSRTARPTTSRCRPPRSRTITRNQAERLALVDIARVRDSEPHDVLDRCPHRDQPEPDARPHVVLADHPALGAKRFSKPIVYSPKPRRSSICRSARLGSVCRRLIGTVPSSILFGFPVTEDAETNRRNREKFERLVRIAAEHGWGEYRTPPAYQDAVIDTYSFNNHALRRFHQTLKDAVDPNGILAAGRYGIWPKHLRKG